MREDLRAPSHLVLDGRGFEGMKKFARQVVIFILWFGLATPLYAVEIINNISSSASTGGNSVGPGGEVIERESEVRVKIYTEMGGVVVENIDETVVPPAPATGWGQADEDAVIEKRSFMATFLSKIFNYVFSIF